MSVSEFERHRVFQWFEEEMGPERAATMMQLLPPVSWTDIATKDDLRVLEARLVGETATVRGEMRGEMAMMRGEMAMMRGELLDRGAQQVRNLFLAITASNATLVGLVLAVVRIG